VRANFAALLKERTKNQKVSGAEIGLKRAFLVLKYITGTHGLITNILIPVYCIVKDNYDRKKDKRISKRERMDSAKIG